MNIGMILENSYSNDNRVRREAETLAKEGFGVFVLGLQRDGALEYEEINRVKVIRFKLSEFLLNKFRGMVSNFPLYYLFWRTQIEKFINEYNIQVLHVHDLPLMPLAIKVAGGKKIPVVGDFHENFAEQVKLYYWANTTLGKILINKEKWAEIQSKCVKKLDKIIVVADETVEHFAHRYDTPQDKFTVVDNSIDINQFKEHGIDAELDKELQNQYKNKIVLGFTGGILPNRGLQHLLKLLPKFTDANLKIVIAGRGKYMKVLKEMLEKDKTSYMVDWYDWQPFRNLLTFTKNFDIGLTRLERNLQNDYTTPNKVFQYMYMGVPVLTADSLPMLRIVGETDSGFVFKSGDYQDLENKLRLLIDEGELRKKKGANGKKAILLKYNWEVTGQNLVNLYKKLLP
jgi:glycosyltransferase involved in cell wall biosynthesis